MRKRLGRDEGSAVAEFVMILGLVIVVFGATLQLAYALYVRNIAADAAIEGAMAAARSSANSSYGEDAALARFEAYVPAATPNIAVSRHSDVRGPFVRVRVQTAVPIIGPFGFGQTITSSGEALIEQES